MKQLFKSLDIVIAQSDTQWFAGLYFQEQA